MSDEQPPLFDMAPVRAPRRRRPPAAGVRYEQYHPGRHRRLCDDCIADIHARGVAAAPLPARARWRRRAEGEDAGPPVLLLCEPHKERRIDAGR